MDLALARTAPVANQSRRVTTGAPAERAAAKGVYVRNVAVSSTMGPGVSVDTTQYR